VSRPRVLFVDDDGRILDGLRRSLRGKRTEWDMSFVDSGAAALDLLAATPHDVVVSDMRMPGMDGAELLTHVSRRHPEVARVVLSGHTEQAAAIKVAVAGHRFLTKPTDIDNVVGVITELTDGTADPQRREVRRRAGAVRSLPAPQPHIDRLTALVGPPAGELSTAVQAVSHSIGLTAKLLQLSTSPFFNTRSRVASLDSVVNALGLPTVQALIGTGQVLWCSPAWGPAVEAQLAGTIRHAVATCYLIDALASPGNRPYAQAAALLQDVGRLVWLAGAQATGAESAGARNTGAQDTGAEGSDADCRDVGVELLRLWGLPAPIVTAVAERDATHRPSSAGLGISAALRTAHLLIQRTESRDPHAGTHGDELAHLLSHPQLAAAPTDWGRAAEEAFTRAGQWDAR
jgi:CheY-like chemotaxis protein